MDGISPRKQMAIGGSIMDGMPKTRIQGDNAFSQNSGPNFGVNQTLGGVPSLANVDKETGMAPHLMDHERGAKPPIPGGKRRLHNQANPDHGPHAKTMHAPGGPMPRANRM